MSVFTSADIARVRELHAAGWTGDDLRRILGREGRPIPSVSYLGYMLSPKAAEAHRVQKAEHRRHELARTASFKLSGRSDVYADELVRRLAAKGLGYRAVTSVCEVVLHDPPSVRRVREVMGAMTASEQVAA